MAVQIPEYGEEQLIEERDREVEGSSHGPLPRWEDLCEVEVAEHKRAEEETRYPASENHGRPGRRPLRSS